MTKTIESFDNLEVVASTDRVICITIKENDCDETKIYLSKGNAKWLIKALKQARELAFH